MELIRVTRDDMRAYAKRLSSWGFSLPQEYLAPLAELGVRSVPVTLLSGLAPLLLALAAGRPRPLRRRHRPPRAREPPPSGAARASTRVAAVGRQRRVRLHRRRDRPADLRRGLRPDDPARHALAVGLAHGAQPERLVDRPLPLRRSSTATAARSATPTSPATAHARDRVAARQPAPPAPRPDRLPARRARRARGDARRPHRRRADARPLERRAPQPLPARRRSRSRSRRSATRARRDRGARRLAARRPRADRASGCASPTARGDDRGRLDPAGGARDEPRPLRRARAPRSRGAWTRDRYAVQPGVGPRRRRSSRRSETRLRALAPSAAGDTLEAVVAFAPDARGRERCPASTRRAGPRASTGTASGPRAAPSTSRGAATPAGASSSGASCSRST